MLHDNGILTRLPGEYVSAGLAPLPDPMTAHRGEIRRLVVSAGPHGRVRVTYKLLTRKSGEQSHHFWCAIHAEQIGAALQGAETPRRLR
ncbi:MAG: hypothetical protein M0R28_10040 [Pigmentiphaga sp.]|nr:hypothetical protein [Pigmentiphaga sp.]